MAPPRRGEARRRHGRRLPLLALVVLGAFQLTAVSSAEEPMIEPAETTNGYAWEPEGVASAPGGSVAFRNPSGIVPHGVHWTGGPESPSCSGIPVDGSGTSWSGACTFAQAGTYTFVCTVHPEEMRGAVTVGAGETPPAPGEAGPQAPPPPESPVVEALRLPRRQQGTAVRGSITVSSVATGGHLAIALEASRASLGLAGRGEVGVGKLSRDLMSGHPVRFALPLRAFAKRALQRRGHLSVGVKTIVTGPSGSVTTMTRRVELHA